MPVHRFHIYAMTQTRAYFGDPGIVLSLDRPYVISERMISTRVDITAFRNQRFPASLMKAQESSLVTSNNFLRISNGSRKLKSIFAIRECASARKVAQARITDST